MLNNLTAIVLIVSNLWFHHGLSSSGHISSDLYLSCLRMAPIASQGHCSETSVLLFNQAWQLQPRCISQLSEQIYYFLTPLSAKCDILYSIKKTTRVRESSIRSLLS